MADGHPVWPINHAGRDPLVGKTVCTHRGLRNELETEPEEVAFTGKPQPYGGFYGAVECPDCGEYLRFKAHITELWPASWRVVKGKPVPPDRVAERVAEIQKETELDSLIEEVSD